LRRQQFTVGSQEALPGINSGVVGMALGDVKQLMLQPEDAFGPVRCELIKTIPRDRFPTDLELHVGQWLSSVGVRSGRRHRVKVIELNSDVVIVDGNHPLAGRCIDVEFELIALDPPEGAEQDVGGEG
jgi:peptidylprolyl isomerase